MARIGDVPEIKAVKSTLERLVAEGLVARWELPYENLLTRVDAARFFLEPMSPDSEPQIWVALAAHGELSHERSTSRLLSPLAIEFSYMSKLDADLATSRNTTERR
jgi:hypothetical protein